jgi:hypothetical protein
MLEKPKLEEPEKQAKLKARRGGQRYQKSTLYVSFRIIVIFNLRRRYLASLRRAEMVAFFHKAVIIATITLPL